MDKLGLVALTSLIVLIIVTISAGIEGNCGRYRKQISLGKERKSVCQRKGRHRNLLCYQSQTLIFTVALLSLRGILGLIYSYLLLRSQLYWPGKISVNYWLWCSYFSTCIMINIMLFTLSPILCPTLKFTLTFDVCPKWNEICILFSLEIGKMGSLKRYFHP